MKICVWKTGHEIADTVADSVFEGLPHGADIRPTSEEDRAGDYDLNIGYGILRGMESVFRRSRNYIHLDRGYTNPGHYSGNYRVSLNGTQQVGFWPDPVPHDVELKKWRGFDVSKPVLVCPPTEVVKKFFSWPGFDEHDERSSLKRIYPNIVSRFKGDASPINFHDYNYVLTFNSGVGWQAIAAGIPCVSDSTYSMVGSFFKNIPLAELSEKQYIDREKMFGCMKACDLTLQAIREGNLWPLMQKLLYMSVSTQENQSPAKFVSIQSLKEQNQKPMSDS